MSPRNLLERLAGAAAGYNRMIALMPPATKAALFSAMAPELRAWAVDRNLPVSTVYHYAAQTLHKGRVPEIKVDLDTWTRGDVAALRGLLSDLVLNLAEEGEDGVDYEVAEVSPPGFSGTVKAMKKHKDIDNPFALSWYLYKKGAKPHYKPEKKPAGIKRYISPEKYAKRKKAKK